MPGPRWQNVIDAIKAQYPGAETWLIGAEHRSSEDRALNRIVAYPLAVEVGPPSIAAAQARSLGALEPHTIEGAPSATDDILFERRVTTTLEVWAPDSTSAENRICALLVALDTVMHSTAFVDSIAEDWGDENRALSMGGVMVSLSFRVALFVTTSDVNVVQPIDPPDVGAGVVRTAVTGGQVEIDWTPSVPPEPLVIEYPTPDPGD